MSILGRSIIAGLLVAGFVGVGAGSVASSASPHWNPWGPPAPSNTTQKITFTSTPPSPAVVGGAYTPTASVSGSGNPVIFSIDWSARGNCSISGATVTFVADGTCVIDANEAGAHYEAATQVQQSFAVIGTQSIKFTSNPPPAAVAGGTYTPTATGGASANPVTFSIDASAHGSCSISGATVTFVAVGTCVIDANQAGNATYAAATQVQQSFAVLGTQTITFTSTPPSPAVIGGTYPVTASGGASGNPVTFSVDASADGSCSISGTTVTFVAVGTCVIDANQAGNANYEAATQVQQSFDPDSATQSITFTSTPPSPALVGGTYPVTASGGASGNPVTFSVDASAGGSCSVSGATVTFVAVGTCVIDANQAGNANYEAATQVQQSFDLDPGTQSITFTSTPPSPALVGGTYPVTASGGASGNPVTFSIDASADGSCSVSGAIVTFVADGTCVIDANQAGNANYAAATQVQQSFDPDSATQSITFTSTPPSPALVGGTYPVTASGGASGNPVTLSVDASADGSCSVSGAIVTFVAVGTCVIDANQAGNATYAAATQVQQSFAVLGTQTITFTSTPPKPAVIGGTYPVTASGGASGNPVTFSVDASADGSCSVSGTTVTFVAVGTCVIDANQAGSASYEAATPLQQSFAVLGTQTITFTSTPPKPAVIGGTYPVTAGGGASGNPVTFSVDASADGSCSISGTTVTFVAVGTCVIDANQAGSANYEAATLVQQSFAVLGTQTITFSSTPPSPALVGGTYTPAASGGASGNPVTFSVDASADGSCSISGTTVTFVAAGTCIVDANQAGNANYEAATQVQQSFAATTSSGDPLPDTPDTPAATGAVICGQPILNSPYTPSNQSTALGTTSHVVVITTGSTLTPSTFNGINTTYYIQPGTYSTAYGFSPGISGGVSNDWIVGEYSGGVGATISFAYTVQYGFTFPDTPGSSGINDTVEYMTMTGTSGAILGVGGAPNYVEGSPGGLRAEYNTLEDSYGGSGGVGIFVGSYDIVEDNCLTHNGQYGFSASCGPPSLAADCNNSTVTDGSQDITMSHNEISDNDVCNWTGQPAPYWNGGTPPSQCGSSTAEGGGQQGGGKFYQTLDTTFTDNYVHDNYSVGAWWDTNNAGETITGNYFSNNNAGAVSIELSVNATVEDNAFVQNGLQTGWCGGKCGIGGGTSPALFISNSGGNANVASTPSGAIDIEDNLFQDNWSPFTLYSDANRFCGSPHEGNDYGFCSLGDVVTDTLPNSPGTHLPYWTGSGTPSQTYWNPVAPGGSGTAGTTAGCSMISGGNLAKATPAVTPTGPNYWYNCQFPVANVDVADNTISLNASNIDSALGAADACENSTNDTICGQIGFYSYASGYEPYSSVAGGDSLADAMVNCPGTHTYTNCRSMNNVFAANTYTHTGSVNQTFLYWDNNKLAPLSVSSWQATGLDAGSSFS